ncbi:hypothetical protein ACLB2K_045613 [Fragaria x ananassa]
MSVEGTVVLVFQPAEEGGAGAKKMIEDGALEHVTAIFGLHLASDHPIGLVASKPGPRIAASGFFEALISGKGGCAAIPQHTIDPILAASNVIVSLQHLVSREADPLDSQVPADATSGHEARRESIGDGDPEATTHFDSTSDDVTGHHDSPA